MIMVGKHLSLILGDDIYVEVYIHIFYSNSDMLWHVQIYLQSVLLR